MAEAEVTKKEKAIKLDEDFVKEILKDIEKRIEHLEALKKEKIALLAS